MKAQALALVALTLVSATAHAAGLFGIAPGFSGYNLVKINTTTGAATVVAPLGMDTVLGFNALTYDSKHHRFIAVANMGPLSSYLIAIDPVNYGATSILTSPPLDYYEGIEYLPWVERLATTAGSTPNYSNYLWIWDIDNLWFASGWIWGGNIDMDTLFTDGQNNVCHLDVNNAFDTSPRHIINNALGTTGTATFSPVGDWSIHNGNEYDAAYHPVQNRVYVTRVTNAAYYNAAGTTLTNLPSYGGYQVTCLAYAPEFHNVYGTLVLDDTLGTFANGLTRTVNWAIKQGTTTVASGSTTTASSTVNFSVNIPDDILGYSIWEWDAGSHVKEKLIVIMPGTSFGFGTVHLTNGDADHSGEVDAIDIDNVIANFGNVYPGPGNVDADVDVSGEVDAVDIDIVIGNFGATDD